MQNDKNIKGSVRFNGASQAQIQWGSNDDPNPHLTVGTLYDVIDIEIHSMHTKITLVGFEQFKFNDESFDWADESVKEKARQQWQANRKLK